MARVRLKPLSRYPFSTNIDVRITDINYGGHLGNDSLLSLVHEARVAYLTHHGLSEKNCFGTSLIIADAVIVYQGEAFAGDVLKFEVGGGEPSKYGFRLFYRVTRQPEADSIALVENGMVCFDYEKKKVVPLPQEMIGLLEDGKG